MYGWFVYEESPPSCGVNYYFFERGESTRFLPAYRRVKACTDGPYMPVRTYTVLYTPIRGVKIRKGKRLKKKSL